MANPTGLYSRVKTWGTSDTVLASDLNAEFNNVLNNFNPEMLAGYSVNAAQMQIQTYPGAVSSESLAVSIAGELERLRYQLNAIQGTTYWYQSPAATIAELVTALGSTTLNNKITSGVTTGTTGSVQPAFLVAANTTNTVNMPGATTSLAYTIAGSNFVIASNVSVTGLTAAPSSNNTCVINDLTLAQAGTASTMLLGENGSQITVSSMGSSVSAQVGNLAAFQTGSGTASEIFICRIESSTQLTQVSRGYFFNSSSSLISRGTVATGGTLTYLKLAWIYANTSGSLSANYDNPFTGGIAPASPNTGDYWFDTATNVWMVYSGGTWQVGNVTLIGLAVTNSSAQTIATRSFDFYNVYNSLNTVELWADQTNNATSVRGRLPGGSVSVYGTTIVFPQAAPVWTFATNLDTGSQQASTIYYFYLDTNGTSWISLTAPFDRRADLQGYYHPGKPWRCLGYGWSNPATQLENVESFYKADDAQPVSNITASQNNVILPYNIIQKEQIITLTGAAGAFTQVLPPPAQLKGKQITYVRTDNTIGNLVTLQSWGTAVANYTGTATLASSVLTGLSSITSLAAGQLITGPGVAPNTTVLSATGTVATMSANAIYTTITSGTFNFANAAGYAGTVGQQTGYASYGINGRFSLNLILQGESVTIGSDGYSYFILNRFIPTSWFPAGVTNITASTTAPTKGTIVLDLCQYRRVGGNFAEVTWNYQQSAAGTAGSGSYLFTLPAGMTIDTTVQQTSATITSAGQAPQTAGGCGIGVIGINAGGYGPLYPYAYDSTHVASQYQSGVASISYFGSTSTNFATAATFGLFLRVELPILNWGI